MSRAVRLFRCTRGSNAVEFALVAPVFILMLMGLVWAGLLFGMVHSTQQLAADGARHSLGGIDRSERLLLARGYIEDSRSRYFMLGARDIEVDVSEDGGRLSVALVLDVSDMALWLPVFGGMMTDGRIERSAVTFVDRAL